MMKKQFDPKKTLFLIDGSSFLYRAYYGMRPMHTPQGEPIHAVYSFCRMIKKLIDMFDPQLIALVWDSKGKTERHEIYQEYKATREAPPSDLFAQKEHIQEFADMIGLQQVQESGIEADDLMYAITREQTQQGYTVVLVTSDKDMGQILSDQVYILDTFKDILLDVSSFEEKIGFSVAKLPFYFALLGDTSDNIPGVKGIGKKGAQELVTQFDSLQDLYENLDQVKKDRMRNALAASRDNAFLSLQLFLLRYKPTGLKKEDFAFDKGDWVNAQPLFEKLNFKSLLKNLEKYGVRTKQSEVLSKAHGYNFICVNTQELLDDLCKRIRNAKFFVVDTELTGLDVMHNECIGLSICVQKGTAYYVPFGHKTSELQLSKEAIVAALKPIFADPEIHKCMHHAKFDELALWPDMPVNGLVFDTLIAASLVTEDWQRIGLKHLSEYYLKQTMLNFDQVVKDKGYPDFSYVPLSLATEYAAADAHQTFLLMPILQKALEEQKMVKLYNDIEHPLIQVLFDMHKEGIFCDINVLKYLDELVSKDIDQTRQEIIALIGDHNWAINLNSPKQLEHVLFHELKLPPKKKSAKGTGYSTDQEVLEELAKEHPVPALIVRYRGLYKLKSTYIDALPRFINSKTGKIHSNFSQTRVATGRLSSSDPNMQNIPADAMGYDIHIRSAFKPDDGYLFLSADYSQIELRVLAYLSQDKTLVGAFLAGRDIHAQTAAGLFDVPIDAVTHEQRQIGKRINFSILYGLTPYGLSKDLNISFTQAKEYIDTYFAEYPGVSKWMEKVVEQTKEHGYVTTHWGRRRGIPGIYEDNKQLYELAKRVAINTCAQGTAAEIMKQGMIHVARALREQNIDAKILLQIHDELIISVRKEEKDRVHKLVKELLQSVVDWNVPLVVDLRWGVDWYEVSK